MIQAALTKDRVHFSSIDRSGYRGVVYETRRGFGCGSRDLHVIWVWFLQGILVEITRLFRGYGCGSRDLCEMWVGLAWDMGVISRLREIWVGLLDSHVLIMRIKLSMSLHQLIFFTPYDITQPKRLSRLKSLVPTCIYSFRYTSDLLKMQQYNCTLYLPT